MCQARSQQSCELGVTNFFVRMEKQTWGRRMNCLWSGGCQGMLVLHSDLFSVSITAVEIVPICFLKFLQFCLLHSKRNLKLLPLIHFAQSCLHFKNFYKDNRSRQFQPESKFNGEMRSNPQRVNYSSSN